MSYLDEPKTYEEARNLLTVIGLQGLRLARSPQTRFFLRTVELSSEHFPRHFLMLDEGDGLQNWIAVCDEYAAQTKRDLIPSTGIAAFDHALNMLAPGDQSQVRAQLAGDICEATKLIDHIVVPKAKMADDIQARFGKLAAQWRGHRIDVVPVPLGDDLVQCFIVATPLREFAKYQARSERLMVALLERGANVGEVAKTCGLSRQQTSTILASMGVSGKAGPPRVNLDDVARRLLVAVYEDLGSLAATAKVAGISHPTFKKILIEQGALQP